MDLSQIKIITAVPVELIYFFLYYQILVQVIRITKEHIKALNMIQNKINTIQSNILNSNHISNQ